MKPTFKNPAELANYFHFRPTTKADENRLATAWNMYNSNYKGDGCMGSIAEVLTATSNSKKQFVSNTGRVDCYIKYRCESGAVIPVAVERKTNGGRLCTIETEYSRAEHIEGRYVVYSLDVCNAGTSHLRRHVDAVIIPRKLFVDKLNEFNAIKAVNRHGVLEGYGIQATSRKLFDWLCNWPIAYDRNAVYSDDDFEGLE